MSIRVVTTLLILCTLFAQRSLAVEEPSAASMESRTTAALPGVELQSLEAHVPSQVVIGTVDAKSVTFPTLLGVPADEIRHFAVPTIDRDDNSIPDDEWVTRITHTRNISAVQLVPILRPLIPRGSHFAALPDQNALILVDSYANGRRILELIAALDKPAPKGP
jgi:type II/III secretion system protein